ncbi:B12-binding domain-containing radical SAM protein [Desulfovibrio sulfodismutans]|uniref:B12-binding domain-containing radical SAM protein n=1 Tax=Desulfolutivibrio sulfodismutans TaxID=63561 RepID=A0A7K3NH89_9BACT|nr:radical SAM protein [Desulfolutivibrio sulfodismutans]NDY55457.1 B12-binding domain-containing radical SAM protein [Desulfolutivibrio sulfodismutans]QLA12847.1 radical SAM protein [Desulfolutivibrio sulfodismutans DSM 3696]
MIVVLVSPYPDLTAFGLRTLSACLRRAGIEARMVFLPDRASEDGAAGPDRYPQAVLEQLAALCVDAGLIGISLMTNSFDNAVQITRHLRQAGRIPVVWGGVHPTLRPQECLEYADFVCVGEGEQALVDLARALVWGGDTRAIPGIWDRRAGSGPGVPPRPLVRELDRLPAPDYALEGHFVLDGSRIEPLNLARQRQFMAGASLSSLYGRIGYQTLTGRGCPHRCSYCANDALRTMYPDSPPVRWRTADHVMQELEAARRAMPFIEFVWFSDDALTSMPGKAMREFFGQYRERIGLPFSCLTSPLTLAAEKMDILMDAGLFSLQMGVQTGSPRIQKLYNRASMTNERILSAMNCIHAHRRRMMPPLYDIILDAPFETAEDKRQTVALVARMPKPFRLQLFSLTFFPGTGLELQAREAGFMHGEPPEIYRKSYEERAPGYHNLLLTMARGGRFPSPLLRFLAWRPVAAAFGGDAFKPAWAGIFTALRRLKRRFFRP